MPYRAIFSDIDGTLLNREHRMSARTLAALQTADPLPRRAAP